MPEQEVYVGSVGPFLYDDDDVTEDYNGDDQVLRKKDLAAFGGVSGTFDSGGMTITVVDGLITGITQSDKDAWVDD